MKISMGASLAALLFAIAVPAAAQPSGGTMAGMSGSQDMAGMPGMSGMGSMTPMQQEMMMAMQHMNEAMMAASDSDPDRAFAKKMLAHHEGAIAMSEIEIRMGKDAEAKRIAQQTITENREGVDKLKSFLARH